MLDRISALKEELVVELRPGHTETDKVQDDPALMSAIKRSEKDIREGRTRSAEDVFDDLGW